MGITGQISPVGARGEGGWTRDSTVIVNLLDSPHNPTEMPRRWTSIYLGNPKVFRTVENLFFLSLKGEQS